LVGGNILGGYVTPNPLSTDIVFTASTTQYKYGQPVHFSVEAPKQSRVYDEKHVYLAVQIDWTGSNGEAQGHFHHMTSGLAIGPNCANNLYSTAATPFNGSAQFSWTPSDHAWESPGLRLQTRGNATFKLLWANSPTGDVPNPYVYLKTISLWDPKKWNPDAAAASTTPATGTHSAEAGVDACVLPTHPMWQNITHSFKGSPVFIQHIPGEGKQTFAAKRCIRCRKDQHKTCLSAKVECPTLPGAPVVEHLWAHSASCDGVPTRSAALPGDFAACPGETHHSPWNLEMDRFVPKLQRDYPSYFKDNATAIAAIKEYKRMLHLMQQYPDQPAVPSKLVDLVWHEHILDTEKYKRDTLRMFGYYVHHAPSFGGAEEKKELVAQQQKMLHAYRKEFNEQPGPLWIQPQAGAGEFNGEIPPGPSPNGFPRGDLDQQRSPDCCQAFCVKPQCASCVGCNRVDCGYMTDAAAGDKALSIGEPLSPAKFSGYVPTETPISLESADIDGKYLCSASPSVKSLTTLSWSIHMDHIYFKQTFEGKAWYGIGLNNNSNMAYADYMLIMQGHTSAPNPYWGGGNFTGIKDLYKWDPGNGYPCWDIEYECSANNATHGTGDVENAAMMREGYNNTATWARKLVTGDSKDFPILNQTMGLLFANGVDDYFTFHEKMFGACEGLNFYSGESQFCWWAADGRR